ncbi:MAG: hypothetical protein OXP71_01030 [Candidatus Poribacteria bacterium]|nr:hypothetical protein [Candidatus Poribacteria bacterium]
MFRIQNWKRALGLIALGSVFTIIGMSLSPVTAQRDKFGDIECTRLTVVDATGKIRVAIGIIDSDGYVKVNGKDGKSATLSISEHGGRVQISGKGEGAAVMSINEYGNGALSTWDKNGYRQ